MKENKHNVELGFCVIAGCKQPAEIPYSVCNIHRNLNKSNHSRYFCNIENIKRHRNRKGLPWK